jgi:hypothetical protein
MPGYVRPLLIATAVIALAACKRPEPLPLQPDTPAAPASVASASTASSAAATTTPSLGDFKVLSVALGRALDISNNVAEERSVFSPKDPIYAAVVTTGTHQGLMLSALWYDGDGKLLAQNDQRLVPDGPMLATFHLSPPGGWPKGHYKLDIALDGQSMQSKEFDVR